MAAVWAAGPEPMMATRVCVGAMTAAAEEKCAFAGEFGLCEKDAPTTEREIDERRGKKRWWKARENSLAFLREVYVEKKEGVLLYPEVGECSRSRE